MFLTLKIEKQNKIKKNDSEPSVRLRVAVILATWKTEEGGYEPKIQD